MGPKSSTRFIWVPSPVHEIGGAALFVFIGFIEFLGVGMIQFYHWEAIDCSAYLPSTIYLLRYDMPAEAMGSSVESFAATALGWGGCAVDASGRAVGACDACGTCAECSFGYVQEFANAVANPATTTVSAGLVEAMAADGCSEEFGHVRRRMSFIDLLWYSVVLLTTVGYGNTFTPTTPNMRTFTLIWALYGLFMFGAATSVISAALAAAAKHWRKMVRTICGRQKEARAADGAAAEGAAGGSASTFEPPSEYVTARDLYFQFVSFLILNLGSAFVFWGIEGNIGMTPNDAFYHSIMTATTIGLGDIAPHTQGGRLYGVFHMILCTLMFANIIGTILSALDRRAQLMRKQEELEKTLDADVITSLDRDGNGVDKAEFVLGMLEKLNVISKQDYEPFLAQFEKHDTTKDGLLTRDDLAEIVKENQKKAAAAAAAAAAAQGEGEGGSSTSADGETTAAAAKPFTAKLNGHATDLMVPCFLACFGFLWFNVFGFTLLVSGLMHGLAIGRILGHPPTPRNHYIAMGLIAVGGACLVLSIVFIAIVLSDIGVYWSIDRFMVLEYFSVFDDNGFSVVQGLGPNLEVPRERLEHAQHFLSQPISVFFFALYLLVFIYALATDVMTSVCLYMALSREDTQSTFTSVQPAAKSAAAGAE